MAKCRACNEDIRFVKTAKGKSTPVNISDGTTHWATCPQAKRFSRPPAVATDTCHVCGSHVVERLPGWGPHAAALRCLDCRAHRWLRQDDVTPDPRTQGGSDETEVQ